MVHAGRTRDVNDEKAGRPLPAPEEAGPAESAAGSALPPPADSASAAGSAAGAGGDEAALLRDRWLRAEAELQNYRRRAIREQEQARRGAEECVMLEVIGALDDLDRALVAAGDAGAPESWVAGVRLVTGRLNEYLARQGVLPLDPAGERFDPAFHEAVLEMETPDAEPGHVARVVLKGWRRGARALRAARVVVAKAPAGTDDGPA
jgi:molecular chaperone GrpE